MSEDADLRRELEAARATVAAQALQIQQLDQEMRRRGGEEALRALVELADIAAVTVGRAPYQALLEGIVQAARRLFDAAAASIALLDRDANELVFEAATGGTSSTGTFRPRRASPAGW